MNDGKELLVKRGVKAVFVFAAIIIFMLTLSVTRSLHSYEKGIEALNSGNLLAAVTYFERSALYYAPANSYPLRSMEELAKIQNGGSPFSRQAGKAIERTRQQLYPAVLSLEAHYKQASLPGGVSLPRRIAIHLFFFLWIACAIFFFFKGFRPNGEIAKKQAVAGFSAFAVSLLSWLYLLAV